MENIIISNPETLQAKIEKLQRGGIGHLHILSDFDRSFTKCIVDGKRSSTSWAQFRNLGLLDQDYRDRASAMFEYYRPIEISREIGEVERQEQMRQWWKKHLKLLVEKGVSRDLIREIVDRGGVVLRDKAKETFEFLKKKGVPLVFISSGLGDIISGVLAKEGVISENIHIVSNFFEFDESGKAHSFDKELVINSQNKNEAALEGLDFFNAIKDRENIILVGDAVEDLKILDGANHAEAITIGFLNGEVEKNLEIFQKSFDIVILDDGDMGYVNNLMKKILG